MFTIGFKVGSDSKSCRDSIAKSFLGIHNNGVDGIRVESAVEESVCGAFGEEFWAAIAISFPVGIAASVVANWICKKLDGRDSNKSNRIFLIISGEEIDLADECFFRRLGELVATLTKDMERR